jgi:hypothetical protein
VSASMFCAHARKRWLVVFSDVQSGKRYLDDRITSESLQDRVPPILQSGTDQTVNNRHAKRTAEINPKSHQ